MNYEIVASDQFFETTVNVYRDNNNEIYMTRNQIGEALGYSNPQRAMSDIHNRNKERLDNFSVVRKMRSTDGRMYDTHLYTEKGIYEIMRYSKKPKANEFYDFVYELLSKIRKREIAIFEQIPKNYEEAIEQLLHQIKLNKEHEKKLIKISTSEAYGEFKNYYDAIMSRDLVDLKEIAGDYAIDPTHFKTILSRIGLLSATHKPSAEMFNKGFVTNITKMIDNQSISETPMWTRAGVLYIYEKLKEHNVLPIIDLVTEV